MCTYEYEWLISHTHSLTTVSSILYFIVFAPWPFNVFSKMTSWYKNACGKSLLENDAWNHEIVFEHILHITTWCALCGYMCQNNYETNKINKNKMLTLQYSVPHIPDISWAGSKYKPAVMLQCCNCPHDPSWTCIQASNSNSYLTVWSL